MEEFATVEQLRAMDGAAFMAYLGQDGMKWTKAFTALNGDKVPDENDMIGWFCNALAAGEDHGLARCGKIDPMWSRPHDRD